MKGVNMYRKSGSDTYSSSSENRFGYKSAPFRMTEKRPPDYSSESSKLDHEKDVYIRSRTFQNSNWRQPQPWDKASTHADNTSQLSKKEIAAVNSFVPHFCMKKESNYTPTLKAVDNLTPKFLSMDLKNDNDEVPNVQSRVQVKSPAGSPIPKNIQNVGNSWRKPVNAYSHVGLHSALRGKFHQGTGLTASDKKRLASPEELTKMLGSKTSLYEALNALDSTTRKVQVEDFKREEQACEHVKEEMLWQYPNCKVIPYSIRLLGMAHPGSAIYMFFDAGNTYFQASNENKELQIKIRKEVYQTMKNCGHCQEVLDWDVQELVTFNHINSGMNCVISFVNGFKDQNTLLLKSYLTMDKRLRLLVLLVADMVYRYHDISKYFTSYVLNIMVIMYLQRIKEPVLPSLQKLRESFPYENVIIGDFNCGFPKDFPIISSSNDQSVEHLLKGFCAFYKDFNFNDNVISILGPELKRAMFCPPYESTVCEEPLHSYFQSLKKGNNTPKINCDLPVIVQDPFELSCNAAEKVNSTVLDVFKMLCQDGFDILSKWC